MSCTLQHGNDIISRFANKFKRWRKVKKLTNDTLKIINSPADRLELLKTSYRKFSPEMSIIERQRMKKEIKKLERALK